MTMRLPSLIAVHGLKRAGKGTIALHLARAHGYRPVKFAAALKDMSRVPLRLVCGLDEATIERCIESDLKEAPIPALGGKSTRYLMQVVGTEYRETVHRGMWTGMAIREIRAIRAAGGRAVLDDLRLPHEVEVLRPEGAELWLVTRDAAASAGGEPPLPPPWDMAAPESLDLGEEVLREMLRAQLRHCGLGGEEEVERHATGDLHEAPIAALGGRSAAHCLAMLGAVLVPLLARPWRPGPASTLAHVSEQGLPREEFSRHFRNDTTIAALEAQVDAALCEAARAA